ncbi:2-(1,2-epoxy-1,2-dihydrophenyl)acetyl-CoA isomerase [Humibacillus xanthopallidus]|uniref:2-(1,2-epoxy-1,2-dihydrophenyl)acetyl-CoA isomerase n=1 Tax=Humibacillus xanthopallidus TaxID=412689 RepID=A0A543PRS1_9MICO|nr:enoyl-CoA hydratase-related protein [Humibacillus xanthopallidus]TQN46772.1 2-(1,2-epoxy-1,2-dihydrophenyl)acetyl-CoA isomerase [Humibacillus xanthopallidus]
MTESPATAPTRPDATQPTAAGSAPLLVEIDGGVAWLRLNRPDAMNSLDNALKDALVAALSRVGEDPAVRCVVLTGSGRAFCVGQDLKEHVRSLSDPDSTLATTVTDHYNPIVIALSTMNKPVIAALNGVAAGAGLSFALACDFRIAAEGAGLNTSFAGIALSCDSGASWTLPRLVGPARAKELLLLPRTVPADEALALGLVTKVVPAQELEHAVGELAHTLADGPTLAYGSIRRAVAYSAGVDLADALANEADLMALTGGSSDHRAAVDAFLAKEKPTYTGS